VNRGRVRTAQDDALWARNQRSRHAQVRNEPTPGCEQFLIRYRGLARLWSLKHEDGRSRRTAFSAASSG